MPTLLFVPEKKNINKIKMMIYLLSDEFVLTLSLLSFLGEIVILTFGLKIIGLAIIILNLLYFIQS